MKGIKNKIYIFGVILAFLALAGVAEAITGRGSASVSIILFVIGLLMAIYGGYC